MKTLFINIVLLLSLSCFLSASSLSSSEITNMISKIKEEREGISLMTLEGTVNPFKLNEKKVEIIEDEDGVQEAVVEPEYKVEAILNRAAFINKRWYKSGDTLGNYRIGHVGRSSVTLTSDTGNKTLSIKKKKKKMFIKLNQGRK